MFEIKIIRFYRLLIGFMILFALVACNGKSTKF